MILSELFDKKKTAGEKVFVAYLTAGDPDASATAGFVETLVTSGADLIELGVPHSDPVADGPVNVRAAERAIQQGGGLPQTLRIAREIRAKGISAPLVLFTYFNPLLRMGLENFAKGAKGCGITGVLVVDLPPEEAEAYHALMQRHQLSTVFLAAPTTTKDRLRLINQMSSGFVYYVSRAGVTGVQQSLSQTLQSELENLRETINLPICVGFGISTPAQVAEVGQLAEGVVVGSALVKAIEEAESVEEANRSLRVLTKSLVTALKPKEDFPC